MKAKMADMGAALAAVTYTAAILVLLGVRSWQQYQKTGSTGFNGFRGARAPAARVAGIGFVVAVLAGVLSPALARAHVIPLLWTGSPWSTMSTVAGAFLALVGLALAFEAQRTMGISWRIGVDTTERTDLITHGLFALIRNPIFTALLMIQLGTTLMAPTWVAAFGLGALVLATEVPVRLVEEPYLLATHTITYPNYATRAGRFVPLLGRLHFANAAGPHAGTS